MTSTAITATGVRQTQNLTVPSTQNTAPVLEYRCLYTSDLRRKQKRWQDGYLRFHTFNKRIMVYENPSRNYIGDQHWREDGIPEDGDELQLDRPVLVQVAEAIGKTETDLTELLEKRRKPQDTSPGHTADSPRREPTGTTYGKSSNTPAARLPGGPPSQLRPKSLNALLGTPKGPIGRASVPNKSPHDIRYETENQSWEEGRPSKRQRIELPPKERSMPAATTTPRTLEPTITGDVKVNTTALSPSTSNQQERASRRKPSNGVTSQAREQVRVDTPRIDVLNQADVMRADDQEASRKPSNKPPKKAAIEEEHRRAESGAKSKPKVQEKPSGRRNDEPKKPRDGSSRPLANGRAQSRPSIAPIELPSHDSPESPSRCDPPKGKMKLQIASRKPRKKLMYRDLLPQEQPPQRQSANGEMIANWKSRELSNSDRPSKRAKHTVADYHDEEQNRLADRLNRCSREADPGDNRDLSRQEPELLSLFISEEDSDLLPASHHRTKKKAGSPPEPASGRHDSNELLDQRRLAQPKSKTDQPIPKAASTVHDTALTLAKMDEILFPHRHLAQSPEPSAAQPYIQEISSRESSPSPSPPTRAASPPCQSPNKSPRRALVPSSPAFQAQVHVSRQEKPIDSAKSREPVVEPPSRIEAHPDSPVTKAPQSDPQIPNDEPKQMLPNKLLPNIQKITEAVNDPPPTPPPPLLPKTAEEPQSTSSNQSPPPSLSPSQALDIPNPDPKPIQQQQRKPPPAAVNLTTFQPPNPFEDLNNLSIAQKPLPAFQAPKPQRRSPLKKSNSDSSAMGPPAALVSPNNNGKAKTIVGTGGERGEKGKGLWETKEAWDLFGCGRDKVPCCYAEFKRKAGIA